MSDASDNFGDSSSDSSDTDSSSDGEIVTLGKSSAFKPVQWKFPDSNKCPLDTCGLSCSSRFVALTHFRYEHAPITTLCSICNKLFSGVKPSRLKLHYEIHHPNEAIPELKTAEPIAAIVKKEQHCDKIDKHEKYVDKDDESDGEWEKNDLITLNGCKKITYWRFPQNITYCPVRFCKLMFGIRSDAIFHYRKKHADHSILCQICYKPIIAQRPCDFVRHYRRMHPGMEVPFGLVDQTESTNFVPTKFINQGTDEIADDEDDDVIILKGLGRTTKWLFPPNMNHCPVQQCKVKFEDHLAAIDHYKTNHSKVATLCSICKWPVQSHSITDFIKHYKARHPNSKVPFTHAISNRNKLNSSQNDEQVDDLIRLNGGGVSTKWKFPANQKHCPVKNCFETFSTRSAAIVHYKKVHAHKSIFCNECKHPLIIRSVAEFKYHYKRNHPGKKVTFNQNTLLKAKTETFPFDYQESDDNNHQSDDDTNDLIELCNEFYRPVQWKFPPNTSNCPSRSCGLTFGRRSLAIAHFKEKHYKDHIVCSQCNGMFLVQGLFAIRSHYKKKHPHLEPPKNFMKKEQRPIDNQKGSNSFIEDDIAENGKKITDNNGRENESDREEYATNQMNQESGGRQNRSDNNDGYQHLDNDYDLEKFLCPLNECTYASDRYQRIRQHWKDEHSHIRFPELRGELTYETHDTKQNNEESISDTDSTSDDEIITLGKSSVFKPVQWKFPDSNKCPLDTCSLSCSSRFVALTHFRYEHAPITTLCSICNKLFSGVKPSRLKLHYEIYHPNEPKPELKVTSDDKSDDNLLVPMRSSVYKEKVPKKRKIPRPNMNYPLSDAIKKSKLNIERQNSVYEHPIKLKTSRDQLLSCTVATDQTDRDQEKTKKEIKPSCPLKPIQTSTFTISNVQCANSNKNEDVRTRRDEVNIDKPVVYPTKNNIQPSVVDSTEDVPMDLTIPIYVPDSDEENFATETVSNNAFSSTMIGHNSSPNTFKIKGMQVLMMTNKPE